MGPISLNVPETNHGYLYTCGSPSKSCLIGQRARFTHEPHLGDQTPCSLYASPLSFSGWFCFQR